MDPVRGDRRGDEATLGQVGGGCQLFEACSRVGDGDAPGIRVFSRGFALPGPFWGIRVASGGAESLLEGQQAVEHAAPFPGLDGAAQEIRRAVLAVLRALPELETQAPPLLPRVGRDGGVTGAFALRSTSTAAFWT